MSGKLLLSVLSALLVMRLPVAHAKGGEKVKTLDAAVQKLRPSSEADRKIHLARRLMRDNNHEAASALLETLYDEDHGNTVVVNLLLSCYEQLSYFTKAETLCRRLVESDPSNYLLRLRLAENLTRQARLDEAEKVYTVAVSLVQNGDAARYGPVFLSMMNHGFVPMALALIDTARVRLADPSLFALDRGEIMKMQNDYRQAALEFFAALQDSGKTAIDAEKKLLALLDYPESSAEVETTLLKQADRDVSALTSKILSSFYLKAERFDRAFQFAIVQDSLEGRKGNTPISFIRSCWERKLHAQLVPMAEYVLSHYRNHPIIGQTYFLYGDALVQLGRLDEAIAVYDTIFATFPREKDKAEALSAIGNIYLNHTNDYLRALVYFDSVITHFRVGLGYVTAWQARPHCYLRQGDLGKAKSSFTDVLAGRLDEDSKEAAEYHLALIFFLEKQFDSSSVALRKLMVDYPRGFYVNDALQLTLLLDEAQDAPRLLCDFSNALLFEQMRMPDSTAAKLLLVANDANRSLADIALYRLAELSLDQADSAGAIEFIDRIAEEFPESYYLPYGMKVKADICLAAPDGVEQARSIYRRLLEEFGNYPFISEVRKKMRQLEGEA